MESSHSHVRQKCKIETTCQNRLNDIKPIFKALERNEQVYDILINILHSPPNTTECTALI